MNRGKKSPKATERETELCSTLASLGMPALKHRDPTPNRFKDGAVDDGGRLKKLVKLFQDTG